MTDKEKLERLISLESTADSCIHEIDNLMGGVAGNSWYLISDKIKDYINQLQASIDYENS